MTPRNLRPVPDVAPRAIGYVRVSDEGGRGDDLMSPAIQRTAIEDHCVRMGYELIEMIEDIDRTGLLWKRRQIERAVANIEAGHAEVIVVWKVSRVSRNMRDWTLAVDRVQGARGRLESATEPMDTTTSSGRFARGMLAQLAEFESERMGETWRDVHRQRTEAGLPHSAPQRLGYTYDRAAGYSVDSAQEVVVQELYRRYLAGEGLGALTAWLRAEGVTGARGGPWSRFGVAYYLRSGFAAGFLHVHNPACKCRSKRGSCSDRIHLSGAHPAIIDASMWQAVEDERNRRSTTPVRSRVPVSRLAGVVICTGCRRPMQLQSSSGKPRQAYVCRTNRLNIEDCPNPGWVRRAQAEQVVRRWLSEEVQAEVDALIEAQPSASVSKARRDRLARQVIEIDAALGRLLADAARLRMPDSAVAAARDELLAERSAAHTSLERLSDQAGVGIIVERVRGLLDVWDTAEPHEIAALVRHLLRVEVTKPGGIQIVPTWTV